MPAQHDQVFALFSLKLMVGATKVASTLHPDVPRPEYASVLIGSTSKQVAAGEC